MEIVRHVLFDVTQPATPDQDQLIAQLSKLRALNDRLVQENDLLRQRIDYLIRQLYGSKSERLDPGQLELELEGIETIKPDDDVLEDEPPAPSKAPSKPRKSRLRMSMEALPTVEERMVPEEVQRNPEAYRKVREQTTEKLEVTPAQYWRRVIIREVYQRVDNPEQAPITPALPKALLEGSVLSASLLADILDKKYCQHLPFYRQEWILRHAHGLDISRSMLCHWHNMGAQWLQPLYKLMQQRLLRCSYLQADETPVNYLEPGNRKAKKGYFWVIYNPTQGVLYRWCAGRGREHLESLLFGSGGQPFAGRLQCDAYKVYLSLSADHKSIILVSCLAHIRRKFREALKYQPRYAAWVLKQIKRLYAIEDVLREQGADADQREARRQRSAKPIHRWLKKVFIGMRAHPSVLPSSPLGKALDYAINQWDLLVPYLETGEVEIDNNLVENAIRPLKLGAKNWLFIGHKDTGWRTEVVLTMVENVRRHGYSPRAYFQWVFERLPTMTSRDDLSPLLPDAWIAQQRAKAPQLQAA